MELCVLSLVCILFLYFSSYIILSIYWVQYSEIQLLKSSQFVIYEQFIYECLSDMFFLFGQPNHYYPFPQGTIILRRWVRIIFLLAFMRPFYLLDYKPGVYQSQRMALACLYSFYIFFRIRPYLYLHFLFFLLSYFRRIAYSSSGFFYYSYQLLRYFIFLKFCKNQYYSRGGSG